VGNVGHYDFGWPVPNQIKYAENLFFIAFEKACRNVFDLF
jgi:hypothetical protein